jgi:collagen type III alpha
MRNVRPWLASGLIGALVFVVVGAAQGPGKDKKGGPPGDRNDGPARGADGFRGRGAPFGVEQALEDLKLTDKKKEKAEAIVKAYQETVRKVQDLAKSDLLLKMKDILSEQELKTFTAALERPAGPGAFGRGPGGQRGPGGPGGRGPGGPPGGRFGPGGGIERALDDLKLTGQKQEKAEAAVKAYRENVTKLRELAKSDMLIKMKDVLSEAELKTFTAALDRQPRPGGPPGGPDGRGRGGRGPGAGRGLTADQIVERIMSFDKNGDGKITKDELPERMQFLIEQGDTNKDGALDKEEIKKLAAKFASEGLPRGFGGPGAPGARGGDRGPGGPGADGFRGPGGPRGVERALDGLNLSGQKKEKAEAIVKAHEENVRKLQELAKSDLLQKMKGVLSEQELKSFQEALDRQPGPGGPGRGFAPPGGRRRGDF